MSDVFPSTSFRVLFQEEDGGFRCCRPLTDNLFYSKNGSGVTGALADRLLRTPCRVWWVGDKSGLIGPIKNFSGKNGMSSEETLAIYDMCFGYGYVPEDLGYSGGPVRPWAVLNHSKNLVLLLGMDEDNKKGWLNPIPFLTYVGENRYLPYHGENVERIGDWAGDKLSVIMEDRLDSFLSAQSKDWTKVTWGFRV